MPRPYVRTEPGLSAEERGREWSRRWREQNPDKRKAAVAASNAKRREAAKAWRDANKERRRQYAESRKEKKNASRRENRDKGREYERQRRLKFPHKHRVKNAGRVAQELQATPLWLTTEQRQQIEDWYALGAALGMEVDHIVPLRGKAVCGLHVPWNLQLLTRSENAAKGNRMPVAGTLDERVIATAVRKDKAIHQMLDKREVA